MVEIAIHSNFPTFSFSPTTCYHFSFYSLKGSPTSQCVYERERERERGGEREKESSFSLNKNPERRHLLQCFNSKREAFFGFLVKSNNPYSIIILQIPKKMVSFTIAVTSVVLILLPLVNSSQKHEKPVSSYASHRHDTQKVSPKLSFDIALHGLFLWASMGFFMPVGILVIRMSSREECGRRVKIILYFHAILQILSVLLATAGAVMSIKNFDNSFSNNHQRVGAALYGAVWLQALIGVVRPHRGSKGRSIWFFIHWSLGTAVCLLGIINIYTGLQAYHKRTQRSIRLWSVVFTAEICFIAFVYLLQDKWEYIQKEGVTLGNEPVGTIREDISTRENPKGNLVEPC